MRNKGLHKIKKPAKGYTAKAQSGVWHEDCLIHSKTNTADILERQGESDPRQGNGEDSEQPTGCQGAGGLEPDEVKSPTHL